MSLTRTTAQKPSNWRNQSTLFSGSTVNPKSLERTKAGKTLQDHAPGAGLETKELPTRESRLVYGIDVLEGVGPKFKFPS